MNGDLHKDLLFIEFPNLGYFLFGLIKKRKTCHEDRLHQVVHSLTIPPISFHQTENCHESSNKVLLDVNRNKSERQMQS